MQKQPRTVSDIFRFLIFSALLVGVAAYASGQIDYPWQWYRIPRYIFTDEGGKFLAGPLLHGLAVTLKITGVSLVLAFAVGLTTAVFRLSTSYVARFVARVYLELVRNTPLLIQIFFIYFVLSPVLDIGRFSSAVLALSLFEGAYASEIFRSGIMSIARGQWEACHSLGLSTWQAYRHVILPQAVKRIIPPLTSIAVALVKDSALVSTIAIYDLTMQGQVIVSETFLTFEVWFTVAAIYLMLTTSMSLAVNMLDRKLGAPA
jgi:polar amino acid transport system permease protein